MANTLNARNFTTMSYTNQQTIDDVKNVTAQAEWIEEFLNKSHIIDGQIEIDDNFRRKLFASWIKGDAEFESLKKIYKTKTNHSNSLDVQIITKRGRFRYIDPSNITEVRSVIGSALSSIDINGTKWNIIVPMQVRHALFTGWDERPAVLKLLWSFAKDMDISSLLYSENGVKYILRPPKPPKKGKSANGFEYLKFCKF